MINMFRCIVLALSGAVFASHAGNAPVLIGSSDGLGLSDGINARSRSDAAESATPEAALGTFFTTLQVTSNSNQVANPLGDCVAVAPEKLAVLSDAISIKGEEALSARELLEDQISSELEGEPVNIEILEFTAGSFVEAAESANDFVADLDSELLETAMYSPTLMVILNSYGARMDLVQGGRPSCGAETDTAATEESLFSQDLTDPRNLGLIKITPVL